MRAAGMDGRSKREMRQRQEKVSYETQTVLKYGISVLNRSLMGLYCITRYTAGMLGFWISVLRSGFTKPAGLFTSTIS